MTFKLFLIITRNSSNIQPQIYSPQLLIVILDSQKKWLKCKTTCFTVCCCFFYADRLNISSAHHCLGPTKVTEKLQIWQEMDIISEDQNQSTLILLSSINVSVKALLSHCHFCENKGLHMT